MARDILVLLVTISSSLDFRIHPPCSLIYRDLTMDGGAL